MNKKEAVAYAQITLHYMQSSKYNGELNLETLGIEMNQAFKIYPKSIVLNIAEGKLYTEQKLKVLKAGDNHAH